MANVLTTKAMIETLYELYEALFSFMVSFFNILCLFT